LIDKVRSLYAVVDQDELVTVAHRTQTLKRNRKRIKKR
jgi:hypothetical protein